MKFFDKFFESKKKNIDEDKQGIDGVVTEEELAEMIKNPSSVSSRMVRKIVLNGLVRLEREGYEPFSSHPTQKPKDK